MEYLIQIKRKLQRIVDNATPLLEEADEEFYQGYLAGIRSIGSLAIRDLEELERRLSYLSEESK